MMEIGDFYLDRTQYQSAATRFRRVLDDYPGLGSDAEALYKLGLCYEEMKRIDEALRLYHVVLENFSSSPDAERAAERIAGAE
jgi:outer membrane protein assembly factor BamD (BamD/ComL family)